MAPPRHVPPARGVETGAWSPWLEAALLVRTEIPAWEHAEEAWLHWTFRVTPDGRPFGPARAYDPSCHAAVPGEPETGGGPPLPEIREAAARELVAEHLAGWRPVVHRHRELGVISRLDEPGETFRKRCLSPLRPLLQRDGASMPPAEIAARLGTLASGIETAHLGADSLELRCARLAVVWYPAGIGPALAPVDPMVSGPAKESR